MKIFYPLLSNKTQMLRTLKPIKKRFGNLPQWAEEKLKEAKTQTLESWGLKLLDAQTLEEVLQ